MSYTHSFQEHRFEKQNLTTLKDKSGYYDIYKCVYCGLEGKRYGVSDAIAARSGKRCEGPQLKPGTKIIVISNYACQAVGLKFGKEYTTVDCPEEHIAKFANDAWVISDRRNEPVRLLPGEFDLV